MDHRAAGGDGLHLLLKTEDGPDGTLHETFSSSGGVASARGQIQHGGPVSGLLARALEQCAPREGTRLSRSSVEILGPIPIEEVRVSARVVRPGRRIELLNAVLEARDPSGEWHITDHGTEPGQPTMAWVKLLRPLVEGEEPTPTVRLMTVADVANGVGARLDPLVHTFLNTDVSVHLHAEPSGEWTGIRAETSVGPDGIGMSTASLHGAEGPVGRIAQTLLVERHG